MRGQVNELHPCVPAVCQYEIVFHFACFFSCYEWSVGGVSTATHSKFLYVGDSRAACEPFLYAGHVVFGSDDCRMPVYLRKPRTFIVLHPSFEAVRSPCVRIGEHIVQNLDRVAERLSAFHILRSSSALLRFNPFVTQPPALVQCGFHAGEQFSRCGVPIVILVHRADFAPDFQLEFLVFLTCRAGAYSVNSHSCCHSLIN